MLNVCWWNIIITDHNFAPIVGMARLACMMVQKDHEFEEKKDANKREKISAGVSTDFDLHLALYLKRLCAKSCGSDHPLVLVQWQQRLANTSSALNRARQSSLCGSLPTQVHQDSSPDTLRCTNENFYKLKTNFRFWNSLPKFYSLPLSSNFKSAALVYALFIFSACLYTNRRAT